MHRPFTLSTAVFLLLIATASAQERPTTDVAGTWQGTLKVGGGAIELRLVLHLERTPGGGYRATIDSIDQGVKGIPVDQATLEGRVLRLGLKKLLASYRGKLSADGKTITGQWTQRGAELPLDFARTDKPATLRRPQEPKKPYPYRELEVRYGHNAGMLVPGPKAIGKGTVTLAGTLTLPSWQGPHPAVVLVSGSGPQDRNETIFEHKPFLVIADYLTRRGIAVLRFDDRGVGKSTGKFKGATSRDFARDALAGVRYLTTRREVDPERIGIMGHSEGGLIAPMVAAKTRAVAFIVLLAGPAVPGHEILRVQSDLISRAMGVDEKTRNRNARLGAALRKIALEVEDEKEARKRLRITLESFYEELSEKERKEVGEKKDLLIKSKVSILLSPWFRFFLKYDPRPSLRKVACPVLALNGELDLQVDARQNLPELVKALEEGGNRDYTVAKLRHLNHLFQHSKTGALSEYGKIEETFAPVALRTIADWIQLRFVRPR